ncbi:dual specificity protein phosphatase 3-like [Centruroides vittatus]|uniref:dual specificity protein phosphatase 3-like n=1 Tax=Centruroides vittatus TaxID=120091 RepID=UPI00350EDB7C
MYRRRVHNDALYKTLRKPTENKVNILYRTIPESRIIPKWMKENYLSCSRLDLLKIIVEPRGYFELPTDPYNEVFPNIYIGDGATAMCTSLLRRLGITHVLNAAQGKNRDLCLVNTSEEFYRDSGINYFGIEAFDTISFRLNVYFQDAANFIENALSSGGKVYVHCRAGISRSAALVIAYLMIKHRMSVQDAIRKIKENRNIIPNGGFLRQLCELNEEIMKENERHLSRGVL